MILPGILARARSTDPLARYAIDGEAPTLALDFVRGVYALDGVIGPLSDVTTFQRASTGWYFAPDGTLTAAGTDVPRIDHDRTTGAPIGYLAEESRTNLLLDSTAPATQTVTVASGTDHTLSVYGSGSAEITAGGSGTATDGAPLTFTTSATSVTVTVTGSLDVFQLEEGKGPTSPIVTGGSTVTRAADQLYVDKADLPTLATLGTVFLRANMPRDPTQRSPLRIGGGASFATMKFERTIGNWDGSAEVVTTNSVPEGADYAYAVGYDAGAGSASLVLNGTTTTRTLDTNGYATVGEFGIGYAQAFNAEHVNTTVAEVLWFPVRLGDAVLEGETAP